MPYFSIAPYKYKHIVVTYMLSSDVNVCDEIPP